MSYSCNVKIRKNGLTHKSLFANLQHLALPFYCYSFITSLIMKIKDFWRSTIFDWNVCNFKRSFLTFLATVKPFFRMIIMIPGCNFSNFSCDVEVINFLLYLEGQVQHEIRSASIFRKPTVQCSSEIRVIRFHSLKFLCQWDSLR